MVYFISVITNLVEVDQVEYACHPSPIFDQTLNWLVHLHHYAFPHSLLKYNMLFLCTSSQIHYNLKLTNINKNKPVLSISDSQQNHRVAALVIEVIGA